MLETTATLTRPVESAAALLDVKAVAALLACSTRTCYRLADGGLMPRPRKLGALVRWSKADLDQWIAAGCPRVRTSKGGGL
jgi:excisionase family DNA binding protein